MYFFSFAAAAIRGVQRDRVVRALGVERPAAPHDRSWRAATRRPKGARHAGRAGRAPFRSCSRQEAGPCVLIGTAELALLTGFGFAILNLRMTHGRSQRPERTLPAAAALVSRPK